MIKCPLCAGDFGTVSVYMTHLRINHADDANFSVSCGLQGCKRTFNNFYTYRNHVYAMHDLNEADKDRFSHTTCTGAVGLDMDMGTTQEYENDSTQSEIFDGRSNRTAEEQISNNGNIEMRFTHVNLVCTSEITTKAVAMWILKSREIHKLPLSVMNNIMEDIQSFLDVIMGSLKTKILS